MNIEDIEVGKSYACNFTVKTFVCEKGNPIDTGKLRVGEQVPGMPGEYRGFGVIVTRDLNNRLVEVWDEDYQRKWIVAWDNTSNIDEVEWIEE
jgi:hypothetical protein